MRIAMDVSALFRGTLLAGGGLVLLVASNAFIRGRRIAALTDFLAGVVVVGAAASAISVYSGFYRLFDPLPKEHLAIALALVATVILILGYILLVALLLLWIGALRAVPVTAAMDQNTHHPVRL
jgi:hypothetical protein